MSYSRFLCLYHFYDWGDGICCAEGTGGYEFILDGATVASGGEFDSSEEQTINVDGGPVAPPTTPSPVTPPPTPNPVAPPTSTSPVAPPTVPTCDHVLRFVLWTDSKGSETEVTLSGPGVGFSMNNLQSGQTYSKSECLTTDAEYTFEINDTGNDGICCDSGFGFYVLTLDGEKLNYGGATFTDLEKVIFIAN